MICPTCHKRNVSAGHILGHSRSPKKLAAIRQNRMLPIDWAAVDWAKRNADIARDLKVSRATVGRHRQ